MFYKIKSAAQQPRGVSSSDKKEEIISHHRAIFPALARSAHSLK